MFLWARRAALPADGVVASVGACCIHALLLSLQVILKAVTRYERHETYTAFHYAVALKLFLALFLNTGLTVLIVNARLKNTSVPSGVGVFSGQFTHFAPRWYSGEACSGLPRVCVHMAC